MIKFLWKGIEVTAQLTEHGWTGPPDCPLDRFKTEREAAERLGGEVIEANPPHDGEK